MSIQRSGNRRNGLSNPTRTEAIGSIQRGLSFALLFVALVFSPHSSAETVHLVVSDPSHYYREVAEAIAHHLRNQHPHVNLTRLAADNPPALDIGREDLLVSIGTRAAEAVIADYGDNPHLSLFITRSAWNRIRDGANSTASRAVIFIDQPLNRSLALAEIFTGKQRFSAVLGPVSAARKAELLSAADVAGIALRYDLIATTSNPLKVLSPLFDDSDAFIAIPDQGAINRNTARWALHLGFKKKIPVIGFSRAYTEAGAAASIYTAPGDIARQGIDWLETYLANSNAAIWQPYSPRYFSVAVNTSVASVLGLFVDDEAEIRERVQQRLEGGTLP